MQGYVHEVIPQEGPHVVQDTDGNQLNLNDYGNDQEQLQAVIDVANTMSPIDLQYDGLRLFTPYSAQQMADNFNTLGIGDIKSDAEYKKAIIGTGSLSYFTYGIGLGIGKFDFADDMTTTVAKGGNYPAPNPPGGFTTDGTGGFVRFEGTNTLYNVYYAGNFMTGKAYQMVGYSLDTVKTGANIHNAVKSGEKDSVADQRAITNGYNYNRVGWKR